MDKKPQFEIKIEKGIPVAKREVELRRVYPYFEMEVGDSFWAPVRQENICSRLSRYAFTSGKKFVTRTVLGPDNTTKGTRVWRTK